MSESKFVSSIPNNKLEPVFLGGGSGPSSKSSGTYVPAFLRNQNDQEKSNKMDSLKPNNEFKMIEDEFPGLPSTKKTATTQVNNSHYSDALKKDIELAKLKPKAKNGSSKTSEKKLLKKQRILDDDYSDEEYYYSD